MRSDRDFPFLSDGKLEIYAPIFSLHIHSKNLKLFEIKSSKKLIKKHVANSKKEPKTIFVFSIFIKSAAMFLKRRLKHVIKK
jgi:hypothetical protein